MFRAGVAELRDARTQTTRSVGSSSGVAARGGPELVPGKRTLMGADGLQLGAAPGPAPPVPGRTPAAGPTGQGDGKRGLARAQEAQESSRVDRLIHLLTATPPARGVDDWDEAYTFLNGLSHNLPDLLATLSGAADRGYLPALLARALAANLYAAAAVVLSALYAVELARTAPSRVTNEQLNRAGAILDLIPLDQQLQIFEYILNQRGISAAATTLMEGVVAMRERQTAAASGAGGGAPGSGTGGVARGAPTAGGGPVAATAPGPAPVEPLPWAPPGDQPIPFYIGNEAHKGIAHNYKRAHKNDTVLANNYPLTSIFSDLTRLGRTPNAGALNDEERALVPDIVNLTRLHLYEIKPLAAQRLGAARARMYHGLFARAGVAMALGPMSEPGTSGGVPAPGGVYLFWSPEPGVIVYQYRRARLVPVPVSEPEPVVVRRWRLELQPLTPQQRAVVTTTTVGGAMLLVMMLLLSPIGI
ncbi:MAG TPA: hypothetical protein VNO30_17150 [Kofleriaceae bacterium]|nr:hypothetical protein [Kofleriaceae bacterium]